MNNLCCEIGWKSINHEGEQLCGDHIDVVEQGENGTVIVLADGLGSGVKASILSTLTSKIISTMMAQGICLEECVSTIAQALPICSVRGVAYSTFTIIHLIENRTAELIQFDNPHIILIRDCEIADYPETEMNIDGKTIRKSYNAFWIIKRVRLELNSTIKEEDEVTLKTWPSEAEGLRCTRSYQILKDGRAAVNAIAEWVILDCDTRRPRYADSINFPKMDFIKEKAVTTPFKRFKDIFTDDDFVYEKTVRALDIDQSHHTNNVKYCMMILDTFSVKELESMTIKELEICYESESLEGDTLRIYRKEIDNGWQFAIKRDGKTITSAFVGL